MVLNFKHAITPKTIKIQLLYIQQNQYKSHSKYISIIVISIKVIIYDEVEKGKGWKESDLLGCCYCS